MINMKDLIKKQTDMIRRQTGMLKEEILNHWLVNVMKLDSTASDGMHQVCQAECILLE